jgi:hypothetical protein
MMIQMTGPMGCSAVAAGRHRNEGLAVLLTSEESRLKEQKANAQFSFLVPFPQRVVRTRFDMSSARHEARQVTSLFQVVFRLGLYSE